MLKANIFKANEGWTCFKCKATCQCRNCKINLETSTHKTGKSSKNEDVSISIQAEEKLDKDSSVKQNESNYEQLSIKESPKPSVANEEILPSPSPSPSIKAPSEKTLQNPNPIDEIFDAESEKSKKIIKIDEFEIIEHEQEIHESEKDNFVTYNPFRDIIKEVEFGYLEEYRQKGFFKTCHQCSNKIFDSNDILKFANLINVLRYLDYCFSRKETTMKTNNHNYERNRKDFYETYKKSNKFLHSFYNNETLNLCKFCFMQFLNRHEGVRALVFYEKNDNNGKTGGNLNLNANLKPKVCVDSRRVLSEDDNEQVIPKAKRVDNISVANSGKQVGGTGQNNISSGANQNFIDLLNLIKMNNQNAKFTNYNQNPTGKSMPANFVGNNYGIPDTANQFQENNNFNNNNNFQMFNQNNQINAIDSEIIALTINRLQNTMIILQNTFKDSKNSALEEVILNLSQNFEILRKVSNQITNYNKLYKQQIIWINHIFDYFLEPLLNNWKLLNDSLNNYVNDGNNEADENNNNNNIELNEFKNNNVEIYSNVMKQVDEIRNIVRILYRTNIGQGNPFMQMATMNSGIGVGMYDRMRGGIIGGVMPGPDMSYYTGQVNQMIGNINPMGTATAPFFNPNSMMSGGLSSINPSAMVINPYYNMNLKQKDGSNVDYTNQMDNQMKYNIGPQDNLFNNASSSFNAFGGNLHHGSNLQQDNINYNNNNNS